MRLFQIGSALLVLGAGSLALAQAGVTNPTLPNLNVPGNSAVLPGSNIGNTANPSNLGPGGTPTYNSPGTMLNNTPTIPQTNLPSANGTITGAPTLGQPSSTGVGTGFTTGNPPTTAPGTGTGFTTGNTPSTTGTLNTPGVGTAGSTMPSTVPSTTGNLPGQTGMPGQTGISPSSVPSTVLNPAPGSPSSVTNPGPSTQGGLPSYTP